MPKISVFSFMIIFMIIAVESVFSQNNNPDIFNNKNILGRSVKLTMINDVNPALFQKSDDTGYTLGIIYDLQFSSPLKSTFYEISFNSDLYTEDAEGAYINHKGRKIQPQYFTEISSLNFSFNRYIEKRKIFLSFKSYLGLYNKKEPVPYLALYLQGGIDGKGGYHRLLDNNPGQINIATGKILPLIYIEPGIKKYIIRKIISKQDNAYLKVHPGIKFGYPFSGIKAFVNMDSKLPLIHFKCKNINIFKLSFRYLHELSLHTDGLVYIPEIGLEASILSLTLGYTSNFYLGKQNQSFKNYIDEEYLMRLYLKIRF